MSTETTKKLYRSGTDKMVAGVCAGLADYLKLDPTLVRILWVLVTLFANGIGIAAYIVFMIVIPENPDHFDVPERKKEKPALLILLAGIVLVAIGLSFLDFFPWNRFMEMTYFHRIWPVRWYLIWPVVLVLAGIFIVVHALKSDKEKSAEKNMQHRFFRSRSERIVSGVCGGIANYLNVDPIIIRIAYVVLTLFTHIVVGVVAYIAFVIFMPEEPEGQTGETAVTDVKANKES